MGSVMTIGDAGAPNDDASYTGETGDSAWTLQYYRNKASEFQAVLNAVDQSAQVLRESIDVFADDPQAVAELQTLLGDFESKRWQFRATAEAINAGAAVINAAGGRFPQLSIPSGLGLIPAIPAATIAAVGVAAALIVWGLGFSRSVAATINRYVTLSQIADPAKRAEAAQLALRADQAIAASEVSPITSIAGIVKWGAIAAVAFLAWKQFGTQKRDSRRDDPEDD